jgi:putative ribosome biogenesis GTPase RsgA
MPTESVDELIEQLKNLKVQENAVLEKLSRAREQEKAQTRNRTPRNTTYEPGDRVRITNTVKVPFTRSVNERDRTATVRYTHPQNEQLIKVFIITDNGFKTWRLEKNLRRIE